MIYDMLLNGYTVCSEKWGMVDASESFHRIYYVYGGEAYCKFENQTIRLEPKKVYIFPVMRPYTLWQNLENPLDVLWFHVETDIQLCSGVQELPIADGSVEKHLLDALYLLVRESRNHTKIIGILNVLLLNFVEQMQVSSYSYGRFDTLVDYIENHISENLTVQMLADYIGIDRSYFSRKFKSVFNMTPQYYITSKRMKIASSELMKGASIYEAAIAVGYSDEKAFSRAFKQYMEVSPGQYRDMNQVQS